MRFVVLLTTLTLLGCPNESEKIVPSVTVTHDVIREDCLRLGINLGGPNDYGAENYLRNLVPNPGFEPGCWASVASLYAASNTTQVQSKYWDTAWHTPEIGQDEHHWQGGEWELPLQGLRGDIVDFLHMPVAHNSEVTAYTWILDQEVEVGDREPLIVRLAKPATGPEPRPNSTGQQSVFVASPGNDWQAVGVRYFDTLALHGVGGDGDCGPLRLLRGPHVLRFWAKGPGKITFELSRGANVLVSQTFDLTGTWREYTTSFEPNEPYVTGASPPLALGWKILSGNGFYLDDMFLGPVGEGAFADEVVDALKDLRPGVIRGWQGFHGDSLDNLLADEYARGPREYRPRGKRATAFGYGVRDLLELCHAVDALPWVVVPPTLSDEEMEQFGHFIEPWTDTFSTIYVEFGNESWGTNNPFDDPFAGGSFFGGEVLGTIARKRFESMGGIPGVTTVVGGQAAWAGQNEAIRDAAGPGCLIPVAPYFGKLNDRYATAADMFSPLYARAYEDVTTGKLRQSEGVAGAVYEINFHTTAGAGGNKDIVNAFVAGQAGGIALPLYSLSYLRSFGWQPQAAFTLAQYSAGGVRMWGVYRDLMATGRPRPTGLALTLANRAIMADMVRANVTGVKSILVPAINGLERPVQMPTLEAFAWRDGNAWSLILFNLDVEEALNVSLFGLVPDEAWALTAPDPLTTNEDSALVDIEPIEWLGLIPKHSMVVLRGHG